jgi:integrase
MSDFMESEFRRYLIRVGIKRPNYYIQLATKLQTSNKLTKASFWAFVDTQLANGVKPSSINRYMAVVKLYGRFRGWAWVENLHKLKEDTPKIGLLSDDEVEAFLSLPPPPNTPVTSWNRWTLFFSILAFSGMRPNECATLTVEDIDFTSNNFLLWDTKTNVPRRVPIAAILQKPLRAHCASKSGLLFSTTRQDATVSILSPAAWRAHFRRRLAILKINRRHLKPYSFRHSYVTDMLSAGVGESKVQKLVGHRDIRTTQRYTHLVNKDVQEVINQHPILQKSRDTREILQSEIKHVQQTGLLDREDVAFTITKNGFSVFKTT